MAGEKFIKIADFAKNIALARMFQRRIPLRVKYSITYRCNLDCPFCLFKTELNKTDSFEMTTSQIKGMMREFKQMGTKFWLFSGGEPLLRNDLGELIRYAKDEMDFYCGITTNGVSLAEKLEEKHLLRRLDFVQISLDGNKEIQDSLRGKGTYDKIVSALNILKKLHINIIIIVLVSKCNIDHLDSLIKLAAQYKVNIAFQAAGIRPAAVAEIAEDFLPAKDIFRRSIEELIKEKNKSSFILSSLRYLETLKEFWPDVRHNIRCYAGQISCEVSPQGFVGPCCVNRNLLDNRFNGLEIGFKKAFFQLDDMSECRDCYYAGPQELNIVWEMFPFRPRALYRDYFLWNGKYLSKPKSRKK